MTAHMSIYDTQIRAFQEIHSSVYQNQRELAHLEIFCKNWITLKQTDNLRIKPTTKVADTMVFKRPKLAKLLNVWMCENVVQ
jgi:hypothetical protein